MHLSTSPSSFGNNNTKNDNDEKRFKKSLSRKDTPFLAATTMDYTSNSNKVLLKRTSSSRSKISPTTPTSIIITKPTTTTNNNSTTMHELEISISSLSVTRNSNTKTITTTTPMQSNGFYNSNSTFQAEAIRHGLESFRIAASEIPLDLVMGNKPLHFAEYGSSQGGNSVAPFSVVLGVVGELAHSIEITHTDLVSNDWNSLLQLLDPQQDSTSYVRELKSKCFVSARGGSFHTRLFPPETIHLGWSSIANHWLSSIPPAAAVVASAASASTSSNNNRMFLNPTHPLIQAQAHQDWVTYLTHRRDELVKGGQLVNVEIIRVDGDDNNNNEQKNFAYNKFCSVALQLLQQRFGSEEIFIFPVVLRSMEDLVRPFENHEIGSLKLKDIQTFKVRDVFQSEFQQTGDGKKYAQSVVNGFRAVSACLKLESRFDLQSVEAFYNDLTKIVEETAPQLTFGVFDVCVLRMVKE
jgi:hypothetical protein